MVKMNKQLVKNKERSEISEKRFEGFHETEKRLVSLNNETP